MAILACVLVLVGPLVVWPQKNQPQRYALIYGTVYGADGRHVYGATVKIRRAGTKKVLWELTSDHAGEFAQRVPPGPADYVLWVDLGKHSERSAEDAEKEAAQGNEKGAVHGGQAVKVHISGEERLDLGLHLPK
ncbi:MAG TPA: carboxypeptidase-like regulatory domain-containing protein [Terriglobales bacterium]|nr:carboxypeptidase-like regulatory domain-containing protein [Terriglobales bacterium]